MSLRNEQCRKVCRIIDDALANRPAERDSLIIAVQIAFETLERMSSLSPNCSESPNGWIPCSEYPEYDFQSVLVRWRDRRIGCENDYYLFEGYVVNRHWCCVFEDVDISFLEAIEWKMIKPYQPKEDES